jgi:hypothetical protein
MSLLEKAKQLVKEKEIKSLSPIEQLIKDPEVKKTARYLAKHFPITEAIDKLNLLLEQEGKLPRRKNGKIIKINYPRFKELMPKPRAKKRDENKEESNSAEESTN